MSTTLDRDDGGHRLHEMDWRSRRAYVFERDGYECQRCRRTGGAYGFTDLQVHRLDASSRTDRREFVTLCRHCHASVHDGQADEMVDDDPRLARLSG